jgi:hypothetical protein
MAVVVGTVLEAFDFAESQGPAASTVKIMSCKVNVVYTAGTYASADDSNFSPASVIQSERRNGKTVTILQACFHSTGDENGSIVAADKCTVSGGVVTNQLLQSDFSTEHANGAMNATWNKPVTYCVTFTEPK